MGIFYYFHAVALAEDLPGLEEEEGHLDLTEFYAKVDRGYTQVTGNVLRCFDGVLSCFFAYRMLTTAGLRLVCTWLRWPYRHINFG